MSRGCQSDGLLFRDQSVYSKGCLSTLEAANMYAKSLQQCDAFDYFTIKTQYWAKFPTWKILRIWRLKEK